jgi:AraC family ethanolamine operon transcriptional activator
LERIAESLELPGLDVLARDREVLRLDPAGMGSLRRQALACTEALGSIRSQRSATGLREEVGHGLGAEILRTMARCVGREGGRCPPARERSACLRVAMDLIKEYGADGLTVRELCSRIRCSERTLQYAFKEGYGMGPKAFLQAWRLHRVRRDLANPSRRAAPIADVANRLGFWHMGQFAADYRRMFGELPRETQGRVPGESE